MRTEQEMFDLILRIAENDIRIRAVLLVGSRANSDCPKDAYQDYDITYFVQDAAAFYNNMEWIEERFGKPAVMQLPELNTHPLLPPTNGSFSYLMLFEDGNRIDLSIEDNAYIDDGEPAIILLDKDGLLPEIKVDDFYYTIKRPNENIYHDTCNEFWWCLNNVAKGIVRDELPYVMEMFNHYVRDMLNQMVEWHIGIHHDFRVSAGKMGKYFKRYLSSERYEQYANTYCGSHYESIWEAVFTACELFRELAIEVAQHFKYTYNQEEDRNMIRYIRTIKNNQTRHGGWANG